METTPSPDLITVHPTPTPDVLPATKEGSVVLPIIGGGQFVVDQGDRTGIRGSLRGVGEIMRGQRPIIAVRDLGDGNAQGIVPGEIKDGNVVISEMRVVKPRERKPPDAETPVTPVTTSSDGGSGEESKTSERTKTGATTSGEDLEGVSTKGSEATTTRPKKELTAEEKAERIRRFGRKVEIIRDDTMSVGDYQLEQRGPRGNCVLRAHPDTRIGGRITTKGLNITHTRSDGSRLKALVTGREVGHIVRRYRAQEVGLGLASLTAGFLTGLLQRHLGISPETLAAMGKPLELPVAHAVEICRQLPADPAVPEAVAAPEPELTIRHVVAPGENLWNIIKMYAEQAGLRGNALINAVKNYMLSEGGDGLRHLQPGQVIEIPTGEVLGKASDILHHTPTAATPPDISSLHEGVRGLAHPPAGTDAATSTGIRSLAGIVRGLFVR